MALPQSSALGLHFTSTTASVNFTYLQQRDETPVHKQVHADLKEVKRRDLKSQRPDSCPSFSEILWVEG